MDKAGQIITISILVNKSEKKFTSHVLLIESGSVLDEGLKSLLAREPRLKVSAIEDGNRNAFLMSMENNPDAIVLSELTRSDSLQTSEFLRELLPEENLRVIVVRLEDNLLEVYDKRCLRMQKDSDLIDLIQSRA